MESKTLKAGDLTLEYAEGKLRYIRFGGTELIRGIYFAVRDSDWGTLPLHCQEEHLEFQDGGFTLTFRTSSNENDETVVAWEGTIQGDSSNRITFAITGTFVREYASNRTGFCLLHPLKQLLGQPFEVQSPSGKRQSGIFPRLIAPHQPATDMASLAWKTVNGIACQLTFEGDAFEMEDQRNWTDASFKTYCTPLKKGWPKTYHQGDFVSQTILFQMLSCEQKDASESVSVNSVSYDTSIHFPWPGIGSRIPNTTLDDLNAKKIATLPLNLLRADIVWGGIEWKSTLIAMIDYAEKCGKPLHLVLHYAQGEISALAKTLKHLCAAAVIKAISVVQKDRVEAEPELIQKAHHQIREYFPGVKLGVGTQYLFTQFNRSRTEISARTDFVFFGNNPQVHAFDNRSIIETIEGQGEILKSARAIAPQLPIYVSPIALNAPFSADKLPKDQSVRDPLAYDFAPDPRQGSLFTAGWVLGCLAALVAEGAGQLDFFETEGERGLLIGQKTTPTFTLLDRILKREPLHLFFSLGQDPLKFSSLGIHGRKSSYLYLANHTADRLAFKADNLWYACARMDGENKFTAHEKIFKDWVLELPPFGIVEILVIGNGNGLTGRGGAECQRDIEPFRITGQLQK